MESDDLAGMPIFAGLPKNELAAVARELREVTQPAGRTLAEEGHTGVGFAVVVAGEAEVRTVDGRSVKLARGDHFGEVALLSEEETRSADVVAKTDMVLGMVPEWGFETFLADHPKVAYRLLQTLARRLRAAERAHTSST